MLITCYRQYLHLAAAWMWNLEFERVFVSSPQLERTTATWHSFSVSCCLLFPHTSHCWQHLSVSPSLALSSLPPCQLLDCGKDEAAGKVCVTRGSLTEVGVVWSAREGGSCRAHQRPSRPANHTHAATKADDNRAQVFKRACHSLLGETSLLSSLPVELLRGCAEHNRN